MGMSGKTPCLFNKVIKGSGIMISLSEKNKERSSVSNVRIKTMD